jgi:hypothetical protein
MQFTDQMSVGLNGACAVIRQACLLKRIDLRYDRPHTRVVKVGLRGCFVRFCQLMDEWKDLRFALAMG